MEEGTKLINTSTYTEEILTLSAGVVYELDFKQYNPNVFVIRNISGSDVYLSESPQVSTTVYYKKCLANATTKYISITGLSKMYLYCASSITKQLIIQSVVQDGLVSSDLDEDTNISSILSGVSLGSVKVLDGGGSNQLAIDASGYITSKFSSSLPAGTNSIGKVQLEAGAASIGTVGIETGSNVIGSAKIVDSAGSNQLAIDGSGFITSKLSGAIPSGSNTIGKMNITQGGHDLVVEADGSINVNGATFSGTIGTVKLEDATGTYFLNIDSSGFITSKLSGAIPAGSNTIGSVGLEAGTNNIGDVDILTVASGQNLKPATTPVIYNDTLSATPDTESSQALPAGTKKFTVGLVSKDETVLWKLKFGTGGTSFTLQGNETYSVDNLLLTGQTLYYEADSASETVQIIAYS
jgi:hypothetical protein